MGKKVKVFFNSQEIQIDSFEGYAKLYFEENTTNFMIPFQAPRWEIIISQSKGQFEQVSFVNSINTYRGGTHVNYVVDKLIDNLTKEINKKKPKLKIKPYVIKNNLYVFVNCLIENPTFDTQTKEYLTLKQSAFGSTFDFNKPFFQKLLATDIIDQIIQIAENKENQQMAKALKGVKRARLFGIEKLEDANKAGTNESLKCLLILTEGDSAKSLAMAGLEIVGRDYFGVYPLRGKLLNVREATNDKLKNNKEVQDIIKIIGLQLNNKYENISGLRYGGILIMTDQDVDGSHIKGLIINFIAHFWPTLLENFKFLKQFITPIIKCFNNRQVKSFFSLQSYRAWIAGQANAKAWRIKYYKGLGTSTNEEGKEYFSQFDSHKIDFLYRDQSDLDQIKLLFDGKLANERKTWLNTFDPAFEINFEIKEMRYKDFIDKDLIGFSIYDNQRSISSVIDGLKPSKRKILYGCFLKNLKQEVKVAQLTGYIAEKANYHHGEVSLQQTIVNLAQDFVGSNNINLLMPIGQFGTRALGGKDHASARYIHTRLNPITRLIFKEDDDHVLQYQIDDGDLVEPIYYVPILPMSLVNGSEGIGTGWSSFIPNHSPREIVDNILQRLDGRAFQPMNCYFKNYTGDITRQSQSYEIKGKFEVDLVNSTIDIYELPVSTWTRKYKDFLEEVMEKEGVITDFREYHKTDSVHFSITMNKEKLTQFYQENKIESFFKLSKSMSFQNYVLFNKDNRIVKYNNEKEILEEFYDLRLEYYHKRKDYILSKFERDICYLENKQKFILYINDEKLIVRNRPKKEVIKKLIQFGFVQEKDFPKIKSTKQSIIDSGLVVREEDQQEEGSEQTEQSTIVINADEEQLNQSIKQFNYLLQMSIFSMTEEEIQKISQQIREKRAQHDKVKDTPVEQMWKEDLYQFLQALEKIEGEEKIQKQKADQKLIKKPTGENDKKMKKIKKPKDPKDPKNQEQKSDEKKDKIRQKSIKPDNQPKQSSTLQDLLAKPQHLLSFEEMLQLKELQEKDKKPAARKPVIDDDSDFILE